VVRLSDNNGTDGSAKRTGCVGTRRNGVRALFFRPNPLLILFTQLYMSSSSLRYIVSNTTHIHTHTPEWRERMTNEMDRKGKRGKEWVGAAHTDTTGTLAEGCVSESINQVKSLMRYSFPGRGRCYHSLHPVFIGRHRAILNDVDNSEIWWKVIFIIYNSIFSNQMNGLYTVHNERTAV
jgi:hypothetical protein